jgi:hypothetical protein
LPDGKFARAVEAWKNLRRKEIASLILRGMLRAVFSRPLPLLLLVTALFTFLIQPGELGTADTMHRLQVTHSFWTGEPQVFPNEYPEFGLHGREGRLYAWYGIGQSLLMFPADLVGAAASHLPSWTAYARDEDDPTVRDIVVSISTNILVSVLTALVAFRLLGLLGFSVLESVVGTLGLLFATTHLHYAQNMTENNYILLLTLTGFALQYKWLTTGDRRALFWGSMALGLNLLTRITTALDILGAGCFVLFALVFARRDGHFTVRGDSGEGVAPGFGGAARTYLTTALPVYGFFFVLDRVYQFVRFGSWTNTYVDVFAREQRQMNPTLPANFPFNGGWFRGGIDSGVVGPFLAPAKSIFLFDPMCLVALVVAVLLWKRVTPAVRAFLAASVVMLAAYVAFYARYNWWAGDFAWGDRYISSAVQMATLLALPLLLRYRAVLGRRVWVFGMVVTAVSVVIQLASLAFWLPLEIYQMDAFGRHTFVVFLRFKNIAAFALGRRAAWGLNTPTMFEDPWDAVHITTWNFLPSLLRHVGRAPLWAVDVLYGVWFVVAVALMFASVRLYRAVAPRD